MKQRLPNGNTLIVDPDDWLLLEVTPAKKVVWEYFTCHGSGCNLPRGTGPSPTRAVRLRHGHTLISDHHRVIEVNHAKHIVAHLGQARFPRLQRLTAVYTAVRDRSRASTQVIEKFRNSPWPRDCRMGRP